jgi:hypothetical protein
MNNIIKVIKNRITKINNEIYVLILAYKETCQVFCVFINGDLSKT